MIYKHVRRSVIIFCSIPKLSFYVFLHLVILLYLNTYSIDFYTIKYLIKFNHVCKRKNAFIKDLKGSNDY